MKPERSRDEVLREELVERVAQTPRPRPGARSGAIALVTAFIAGAVLAGGSLSASALVATRSNDYDPRDSAERSGLRFIGTHDPIVGEPFALVADGDATLDVGRQPVGATALVVAVTCVGVGEIGVSVDGHRDQTMNCDTEGGGSASYARVSDVAVHRVAVDLARGSARSAVWAAWVLKQVVPEPSAAQTEALADGRVSYDEYRAGFDRYAACLLAAGFDIAGSDGGRLMIAAIPGEAKDSGADLACYVAEFQQLDIEWQVSGEPRPSGP